MCTTHAARPRVAPPLAPGPASDAPLNLYMHFPVAAPVFRPQGPAPEREASPNFVRRV